MVEKILPWANVAYIVVVALGSYGIYQLNALVSARDKTPFFSEKNLEHP